MDYAASRRRSGLWSGVGFCDMIVPFVKPGCGTQLYRIKGRVPKLREPEKGLKDWVAPLFVFEF
jgi:hypothetical protein